jgi:hypothetical protein
LKEELLQTVWERQSGLGKTFIADCGAKLELLHPGIPNNGSGPDFECGIIKVNDVTIAGNIEIHIDRNDYFIHRHQNDASYSNLLLHVYLNKSKNKKRIPGVAFEICLKNNNFNIQAEEVKSSVSRQLHCQATFRNKPVHTIEKINHDMFMQRLNARHDMTFNLLQASKSDWLQVFFYFTARALGWGKNSDAFGIFSQSVSSKKVIRRSKNSLEFNQSLLSLAGIGDRFKKQDLHHYSDQVTLNTLELNQILPHWKKGKIRPTSLPKNNLNLFTRLSPLISEGFHPFVRVTPGKDTLNFLKKRMNEIINSGTQERISEKRLDSISKQILINSIVPLVYSYGKEMVNESYCDWAIAQLKGMEPEENHISRIFKKAGLLNKNAADTQGNIFWYKNFCAPGKCMVCPLTHSQ